MNINNVKNIIGQPESNTLEYKTTLPSQKTVAMIIAAFANTAGGWLIIGVKERRGGDVEIVGIADDVPVAEVVESSLKYLSLLPKVECSQIILKNKKVYVVEVEKSRDFLIFENRVIFSRVNDRIVPNLVQNFQNDHGKSGEESCISEIKEKLEKQGMDVTQAHIDLLKHYIDLVTLVISQKAISVTKPYLRVLIRLIYASTVDVFEKYLIDLLVEIHYAQPKTLKSEALFTAEEILNCSSIPEIITLIASKRINSLSRGSSKDFETYIKKVSKIELFVAEEQKYADIVFANRNVFGHNNGRVDEKYLRKAKSSSLKFGDEIQVDIKELCDTFGFFMKICQRVDRDAINKYSLSTLAL